jgi:hypothetical protein
MAILGPRPRGFAVRVALVAAMLGVALYSGLVVLAEIDGIQIQLVGPRPAVPPAVAAAATDPRRLGSTPAPCCRRG